MKVSFLFPLFKKIFKKILRLRGGTCHPVSMFRLLRCLRDAAFKRGWSNYSGGLEEGPGKKLRRIASPPQVGFRC